MTPHEALLRKWAKKPHHKNKGFITDGIIDQSKWKEAKIKLLFLLKEAYTDPANPFEMDICEYIRNHGRKDSIFKSASYWAYAVHQLKSKYTPTMPETAEEKNTAYDYLLSSAIVNVKKSNGKKSSDMEEIAEYANKDGKFLKQQIELIGPDIVICGFTWEVVKYLWPNSRSNYDLNWEADNIRFIDFWHPANQFPQKLNYYALDNVIRNMHRL